MAEQLTFDRLTPIFRDVFDSDDLVARADLTAGDVVGWDSLSNVRLFLSVEQGFGIRFNAAEMSGLKNVGALADLVEKKVQRK